MQSGKLHGLESRKSRTTPIATIATAATNVATVGRKASVPSPKTIGRYLKKNSNTDSNIATDAIGPSGIHRAWVT